MMQFGVVAHSVFQNIQLEKVTPSLPTWLRTSDLTYIHRGAGSALLLTIKEF